MVKDFERVPVLAAPPQELMKLDKINGEREISSIGRIDEYEVNCGIYSLSKNRLGGLLKNDLLLRIAVAPATDVFFANVGIRWRIEDELLSLRLSLFGGGKEKM